MNKNLEKLLRRKYKVFILLIGIIVLFPYTSFTEDKYDQFGGWKEIKVKATGFFRVEKIDEKWWLITPEGHGFISKGVNAFWFQEGREKEETSLLRSFGLNTIGAWSKIPNRKLHQEGMPYAVLLDLLKSYAIAIGKNRGAPPDIFTKEFEESILKQVETKVKPFADDPLLIGWWTDNELKLASENPPIIDSYMKLSADAPGQKVAREFLSKSFGSPTLPKDKNKLQEARDGFVEMVVRRYAEVTSQAIRKYDKNHLILGKRLFFTPLLWKNIMPERMGGFEAIGRGAKGYWDVISVNCYFSEAPLERLKKLYESFQGPILISEFNIAGSDKDQGKSGEQEWEARTRISVDGVERQVPLLLAEPYVVGYHYFPFVNYRFPKQNNINPGLLNYRHEPREGLNRIFQKINPQLEEIHRSGLLKDK